ncbi:MAG: ABC transporter substrate-binding protein [Flavobacteriales bacterium]
MTKYFVFCLLLISSFSAFAQNDSIVVKDGMQYKVVKVKPKQTLYGLSKDYSVSPGDIKKANNGLEGGLKSGQNILIPTNITAPVKDDLPVEKKTTTTAISTDPKEEDKLKIIRDFYKPSDSLSKRLPNGVCPTPNLMDQDKFKDRDYVKVAIILPFQLALVDSLQSQKKEFQDFKIPIDVQFFVDFYEGALIALDTLKQQGYKVVVSVYDDRADSNVVKQIMSRPEFDSFDLVIGPAHASCVKVAARICAQKKIYLISAFSKVNEILDGNPYVIKTVPSRKSFLLSIAENTIKENTDANIILVGESEGSRKNVEVIKTYFTEQGVSATVKNVNASKLQVSIDDIRLSLSKDKVNVIIMPSENEGNVTKFVNSFSKLTKDYRIVVYGMESWQEYVGLDVNQMQNLTVHLPAANLARYDYALNDKMIHAYAKRFRTEPSDYAYTGYDVVSIFVPYLKKSRDFGSDKFLNRKWNGTMADYYFVRKNAESGIENTKVGMLVFNNYQLVWVNE